MAQRHDDCPLAPDLDALVGSVKTLAEKIDSLVTHNMAVVSNYREIVRWLVIVVCCIALGRGAFDLANDFVKRAPTSAVAENTK